VGLDVELGDLEAELAEMLATPADQVRAEVGRVYAGLVNAHRVGRAVLYVRSPTGDAVIVQES
jgi:hypothetical protein